MGHIGWGECVPYARYGETLLSVTAQIEALGAVSRSDLAEALPAGAARNAVDCALWDLDAKTAGVRVSDMIGLRICSQKLRLILCRWTRPEAMQAQAALNAFRPLLKLSWEPLMICRGWKRCAAARPRLGSL